MTSLIHDHNGIIFTFSEQQRENIGDFYPKSVEFCWFPYFFTQKEIIDQTSLKGRYRCESYTTSGTIKVDNVSSPFRSKPTTLKLPTKMLTNQGMETKRIEYILEWNLDNPSVRIFSVPFSLKGSSKCTNHVNIHKLYAVEYINTVCSLDYSFQFRIF